MQTKQFCDGYLIKLKTLGMGVFECASIQRYFKDEMGITCNSSRIIVVDYNNNNNNN